MRRHSLRRRRGVPRVRDRSTAPRRPGPPSGRLSRSLGRTQYRSRSLTVVALKLCLAPGFIVAASLVARRFGVRVGGVVGGLPMIAGPILLVLALDRGPTFAGDAAAGTLLGIVAVIAFVLAYVAVSRRFAWPAALVIGWAAFLVAVAALRPVHVGAPIAFALACAACGTTLRLLPDPGVTGATAPHPRWDLPLRAVCAVIPVVAVTGAARLLGPHLSGLPAAFPVITPVLAAFTHAQQGPREVARLLHGFTVGFFAYALFCLAVSTGLDRLGVGSAFVLATALALVAQASAIVVTRRREQLVAAMEA